jgi:methylenetetrahydrofolate dehydrogenase (NADP+)/methenyltetrahydrofolate cyclohydrolase/formyltetrahydrofolate synthetase
MTLIDGKEIALGIRTELKDEIETRGYKPVLAVVLVGKRRDSETYVKMKIKACQEVGIESQNYTFDDDISEMELIKVVNKLNDDSNVDGILVQLPLPKHINESNVIETISPEKDVDGLTRYNQGLLSDLSIEPLFYPCTPKGCLTLLEKSNVELNGKKAVIIGRSKIVGLPMSLILLRNNVSITICHSKTLQEDLIQYLSQADIVIVAIGKPEFVKSEWLNTKCVVIDVGINAVDDSTKKEGYRLVGDVEASARNKVKMITPVPGGVGPMTIAILLQNTVKSHMKRHQNT